MRRHTIYLILLVALLVRLYHITFPVDGWHAWRQADTAAMARNFYDNGFDFLHPQINHGGDTPGYTDAEFPLYSYLVALIWKVAGVHDGWGRFTSMISSLVTIYLLYRFIQRILGERVACWSAAIYAVLPLNIYYSRVFMPHALDLCLLMAGLWFFFWWLETGKSWAYWLSLGMSSLAVAMNPTMLVIGLPMMYLARMQLGERWYTNGSLWLYAVISILPAAAWYTYSRLVLYSPGFSIGLWTFGTDKWGNFDLIVTPKFYNDIFFKSIAERHLTYAGFIPFIAGLFIRRSNKFERVFDWWLVGIVLYFLIVAKGNDVHEYYQLPFILPAVVFIGKTFNRYLTPSGEAQAVRPWQQWLLGVCCIAIVPLSATRYIDSFASREIPNSSIGRLSDELAKVSQPRDLIVTVSEGDALLLYRSHRKGWTVYPDQIDSTLIADRTAKGAKYLAGLSSLFRSDEQQCHYAALCRSMPIVICNTDYFIFALKSDNGGRVAQNPSR